MERRTLSDSSQTRRWLNGRRGLRGAIRLSLLTMVMSSVRAAESDGKKSVLVRVKSNDEEHYLTLPTRAS